MGKVITCGIFLYCVPQERFLLCHATASRNGWSIPKGLPDPGETKDMAAVRELKEETGIDLSNHKVVLFQSFEEVKYQKQNKWLHSFLAAVDQDITGLPLRCSTITAKGYPEVDKYLWANESVFRETAHESQVRVLDQVLEACGKLR